MRKMAMVTLGFIFVLSSHVALAQTFSVGIDRRTLSSIDTFPDKAAEAFIKALREGLPMLDRSVNAYLDKVNSVIAENIERGAKAVKCTTGGTVELLQGQFEGSLASLIFGTSKGVASHIRSLAQSIDDERARFTTLTDVRQVLVTYGDLLIRGAIVECAAGVSFDAVPEAKAQLLRLAQPALEWRLLAGEDRDRPLCKEVRECIVNRRAFVEKFLAQADGRDLRVADAWEQFRAIPPTPAAPSLFVSRHISIVDYETIAILLRRIEFSVVASFLKRFDTATAFYAEAEREVSDANGIATFYENSIRNNPRNSRGAFTDAQAGAQRSVKAAQSAKVKAEAAAKEHLAFANAGEALRRRAVDAISRAEKLNNEATRKIAHYDAAAAEARAQQQQILLDKALK